MLTLYTQNTRAPRAHPAQMLHAPRHRAAFITVALLLIGAVIAIISVRVAPANKHDDIDSVIARTNKFLEEQDAWYAKHKA